MRTSLDKQKIKIVLLEGVHASAAECFRADGYTNIQQEAKTLGIVGYGHIGTQVGLLAESLGMQVAYHDIEGKLALGNARPMASLDALLEAADVVTLHVPETTETQGMIGAAQIARMKEGAK